MPERLSDGLRFCVYGKTKNRLAKSRIAPVVSRPSENGAGKGQTRFQTAFCRLCYNPPIFDYAI
ncbi:hypothetical protein [Kingella potus]|uniref:hypothetical protein n=1 Tax=Kingella potus TaxID=265175 RepID=UPI001FCF8153|nr:hypothetical protein [Kingella potus]UOP01530.1 hypothetical protein LVJ84_04880 [Kingella potus]